LAPHYIMGSISTPSGSLVLEIYHYAHVNGVLGWPENAKSENFDPFSNALKNSFWTILSRMASTFRLVKIENYKGVWTLNFCRNGAFKRFLRCLISSLRNTVTAVSGFLLTRHSTYIALLQLQRAVHRDDQLWRFWGPKLCLRATGIDGALTRLQRYSRSNLRNTVRAVPGFLVIEHSTPTVLPQFATTGTLG